MGDVFTCAFLSTNFILALLSCWLEEFGLKNMVVLGLMDIGFSMLIFNIIILKLSSSLSNLLWFDTNCWLQHHPRGMNLLSYDPILEQNKSWKHQLDAAMAAFMLHIKAKWISNVSFKAQFYISPNCKESLWVCWLDLPQMIYGPDVAIEDVFRLDLILILNPFMYC